MITLYNGTLVVGNEHFPDGTLKMFNVEVKDCGTQDIHWRYENEGELITVMYLVKHIRNVFKSRGKHSPRITLTVPYMPNARLDRVEDEKQVFTLKYFADALNSLHLTKVYVLDPHSQAGCDMINNLVVLSPNDYIRNVINGMKTFINKKIVLCFPDMGAMERYSDIVHDKSLAFDVYYGEKLRNFDTREIIKFELKSSGEYPKPDYMASDVAVLIVDDIISTGETVLLSANKLIEQGFTSIYAYCTHLENAYMRTIETDDVTLMDALNNGTLLGIYTTNSIYKGNHPKVHVIEKV